MTPISFEDLATLLNYSRTTTIKMPPCKSREGSWALYEGEYRVHLSVTPFQVLYLHSRATRADLDAAHREAFIPGETQVVYPPILDQKLAHHRTLFAKEAKGFWTTRDYLRSFVREELSSYMAKLPSSPPLYYLDPQVQVPTGFARKIPNPLKSFLLDPDTGGTWKEGGLAIVLAEPGQGKTYMSQFLVSSVINSTETLVPLFIESQQWHTLPTEDQSSLWKVLAHCFRSYEAPIGWIEGHEDDFIRTSLKAGLFRVIFDGFDEYILKNRNRVNAKDTLTALATLAEEAGTRIVITSRTSFWQTIFPDDSAAKFFEKLPGKTYRYEILPFDPQQAQNYFKMRLREEAPIATAMRVYQSLRKQNEDFAGRGFVLNLLADLVERGDHTTLTACETQRAASWLFDQLCLREQLRHGWPLNSQQQIEALTEFAVETYSGQSPNSELLRLCVEQAGEGIASSDLDVIMDKLTVHPIIHLKTATSDTWEFRHEAIAVSLLTARLVSVDVISFIRVAESLRMTEDLCADVARTCIELISMPPSANWESFIIERAKRVFEVVPDNVDAECFRGNTARLLTAIIMAGVEKVAPRGSDRKERALTLLRLSGHNALKGLVLSSVTPAFDFSGLRFEKCLFDGNTWVNCDFSEGTVFDRCVFAGGFQPEYCRGFGSAVFLDCRRDVDAESWISAEQIKEGKRSYTSEDLKKDIHDFLYRFTVRGGTGFRPLSIDHLTRGRVGRSKFGEQIVAILNRHILDIHHIPGSGTKGIHVRESAADSVRFYMHNNVLTGPLRMAYDELIAKLKI